MAGEEVIMATEDMVVMVDTEEMVIIEVIDVITITGGK